MTYTADILLIYVSFNDCILADGLATSNQGLSRPQHRSKYLPGIKMIY